MIFDTHVHLNSGEYKDNLEELIAAAREKGVGRFLCIGYDIRTSKLAIEIAKKYPFVYASVGLIPTEWKQYRENSLDELRKLALSSNKVVCIGEIGLDYYWEKTDEIKTIQKEMFLKQIDLANELNLPVSLHVRDAYQDTLDILKTHSVNQKGVMHCYSGSLEMAREFIKLGYKIAFGGVLTFQNAKETKRVFQNIDLKDVVFETDAPYLSPMPYRGKRNKPEYIVETVKYASELIGINQNKLEQISFNNACETFHVKTIEDEN